MKAKMFALGFAAVLFTAPAFAMPPNHTVKFVVPVDLSKIPYVKALTVGCELTYEEGVVLTPQQSGEARGRTDIDFSGGEFHQNVEVVIDAPNGPKPVGYSCDLYVTPSDGSGAFKPLASSYASEGVPAEHLAAQGTVPVTETSGTFGPLQIQSPQLQHLQPLRTMKPPPGQ